MIRPSDPLHLGEGGLEATMLRSTLIWLSQRGWAERGALMAAVERLLVRRFVAGDTRDDALAAARRVSEAADGVPTVGAKVSFLGESVIDPADADRAVAEYCALVGAIAGAPNLDFRLSVKPTLLGLDISHATAERGLLRIVENAAEHDIWVEIDMEASQTIEATLALYRAAAARSERTLVALQCYLHRTPHDAR